MDLGVAFNSVQAFQKQVETKRIPQLPKMKQPDIDKEGLITDVLQVGQEVLVQIAKSPYRPKGPGYLPRYLHGRFMVLIPFINRVSVSQKIKSREERAVCGNSSRVSSPRTLA